MRPLADEYHTDHISVLSQTDFSGRVVNNDHFLYWGDVSKTSDDGIDLHFQIVEQTEFIDDASFQPFKGGKTDPYIKRCTATKLTSAEKLMYICKNQLGIEKEYEQKVLLDGRFSVDGFVCVFDVSEVTARSIEKQVDFVAAILTNILRTKKPVVLATTKNDEAKESFIREAEKLVQRKEFRGAVPLVETSSHENVNVELAFLLVAQLIERSRGSGTVRAKVISFQEAARARKELLDVATEAYYHLIRSQVTDYRALWNATSKRLAQDQDFIHFCELFGHDRAQREFRKHIRRLKDDYIQSRKQAYLANLPIILQHMVPDLSVIDGSEWPVVQDMIQHHPDFDQYFVIVPDGLPWYDGEVMDSNERRIPFDLLSSIEAETIFRNHVNALQILERRIEMRHEFKQLLEETAFITPGKQLHEVSVLLMGRECFESLPEMDRQEMYEVHQRELLDRARHNFQELLLEHAELFYHITSIGPSGAITQEDIRDIEELLRDDSRYKILDRLEQERRLMLLQHLGFVHCPIKEHCPSYPHCMDCLVEATVAAEISNRIIPNSQWVFNSENNQLNLVILGESVIAEALFNEIKAQCEDDEYEYEGILFSLAYRVISGDVSLPHNAFRTSDFLPHGIIKQDVVRGCFCVYSSVESFEYVRDSIEKTLLSDLEQEERIPFQGLPIVILFCADQDLCEKDLSYLMDEGQRFAENLQCPFIDATKVNNTEERKFNAAQALSSLVKCIQHRVGSMALYYHQHPEMIEPDIRVIMCLLCGDPYSIEHVLSPLFTPSSCVVNGERSVLIETLLGETRRCVEVIASSYHGANAFRDELVHGFILVYSSKRKASLATLNAFSQNIPNLPIQILAVTENSASSTSTYFANDLNQVLLTEGSNIANSLQAHFTTTEAASQQKSPFYLAFFKEVWDKKPEIEQAFHMEDSSQLEGGDSSIPDGCATLPMSEHRRLTYQMRTGSADGSADSESHYERLTTDDSQGDGFDDTAFADNDETQLSPSDDSDLYSNVFVTGNCENGEHLVKPSEIRQRRSMHDRWTDDTSIFMRNHRDHYNNHEPFCSYTTGRSRKVPPPTKPKPSKNKPGKLDLKYFSNVNSAIARLHLGSGKEHKLTKGINIHAPLATPECVELGCEYAQVKDAVPMMGLNEANVYATVQDALAGHQMRRITRHDLNKVKARLEHHDNDSSVELQSPKDSNSPVLNKADGEKTGRRKDKQKSKDDEKLEKRKQKEEEKQKRQAEKEKEKLEKKQRQKKITPAAGALKTTNSGTNALIEFAQGPENPIPLLLEKCIHFIEEEGLDSEGIYRVPGNRAHVELLFQKFDEDNNVNIAELDIPVNAVATALKDFFSKRLPPLMSQEVMNRLVDIATNQDRGSRLFALRDMLKNMPPNNFEILKFVFQHFVRVAENSKLNSMDSKNLAICWWPTLLPIEFTDMGVFERMRPHLEDTVQTMIDQLQYLFCGQEEVLMV